MNTENIKARLQAWRERARAFVQAHAWSMVLLAVLVLGSVLVYAGAGWWHAQMQAAEARGRAQAMAYRDPTPAPAPQLSCPEPLEQVKPRRPAASRPAASSPAVATQSRPLTELDRRLAAFQVEIDKAPAPSLFNPPKE